MTVLSLPYSLDSGQPENPKPSSLIQWSSRVSFARFFERHVTKFEPYLALNLIACSRLTFAERVVLRRVGGTSESRRQSPLLGETKNTTRPRRGSKLSFLIALVCMASLWIPVGASAKQRAGKEDLIRPKDLEGARLRTRAERSPPALGAGANRSF